VDVSWHLQELTPGRNDLELTAEWGAGDELPGFDRSKGGFVRYAEGRGGEAVPGAMEAGEAGRYRMVGASTAGSGIFSVGMAEMPATATGLRVFPNPAREGFFVYPAGRAVLELFSPDGKLMSRREVSGGEVYFPLGAGVAAGVYWLRVIRAGAVVSSKKIVVIK
jgi:hypothetical protein